jgi:hypothetical protein
MGHVQRLLQINFGTNVASDPAERNTNQDEFMAIRGTPEKCTGTVRGNRKY